MKATIYLFLLLTLVDKSCARFLEGDILVRSESKDNSNPEISGGVILADPSRLWPGGFVYYKFDRTFQNRNSIKQVESMMNYIEAKFDGCITFENIESSNQWRDDFVSITADGGGKGSGTKCFSELGRAGGKQILNLDSSCLRNHTIVHELVHTIGFSHEHNRPDRDSFVTVITKNILESRKGDFKKRESGNSEWFEPGDVDTQNTPFDFQSVLLYPPSLSNLKSISKNGEHTLKYNAPLISSWPNFAPDEEPLTIIDRVEIALAYNCPLDQQTLIQYIHYNRLSSSQKMSVMETRMEHLEPELSTLETRIKQIELQMSTMTMVPEKDKDNMDDLATSACVGLSSRYKTVVAVRRECSSKAADCNTMCQNAEVFGNGSANKWSCIDALHVYTRHNLGNEPNVGKYGPVIYHYGYGDCSRRYCGPNYCCCTGVA
eukprot:GFUD01035342.1.p1 GENE.GFUD01035342.1~~GFUD01035342.1.p1  ORF type:complete len:466 (+),score=61.24 GFUD01035342.1:101-1399(+)